MKKLLIIFGALGFFSQMNAGWFFKPAPESPGFKEIPEPKETCISRVSPEELRKSRLQETNLTPEKRKSIRRLLEEKMKQKKERAAALERRRENRAQIVEQRQKKEERLTKERYKKEERVALQRTNGCSRCS